MTYGTVLMSLLVALGTASPDGSQATGQALDATRQPTPLASPTKSAAEAATVLAQASVTSAPGSQPQNKNGSPPATGRPTVAANTATPAPAAATPASAANTKQQGAATEASKPAASGADAGVSANASAAPAMEPEVKALVDRMQAFYEKTQDFSASFQQDYSYKTFKRKQTSTGTVVFKKPGLMRWEYLKPSARTFVVSNDRVYAYDPAALTLTKGTFDSNALSASVTFLWGRGKLADEFNIERAACKTCKGVQLVLNPRRPDPRFRQVRLEVDPATAQVLRSTVVDPDGSENAITFIDLKSNTGITEDAFKLAPPANTQIIDMTRGAK